MIKWGCLISFPKDDTLAYRLLTMIAISGELPSDSLRLFHRNIKYARTVMYDIRDKDLMRIYYRDKIRGYRLTPQAKAALLKQNPSRFSPYLTGLVETNRKKHPYSAATFALSG